MQDFKSFKNNIFNFNAPDFDNQALELFRYQAENNQIYSEYLSELGISPASVHSVYQIPFLPISMFRDKEIKTGNWEEEDVFMSSGTTSGNRNRHYVESLEYYDRISLAIFELFYGRVDAFIFLALLPSYQEQGASSLIRMVQNLIQHSGNPDSGFYLKDYNELKQKLKSLQNRRDKKVILWGVTYALLDLATNSGNLPENTIVLETGGMKGRREELTRNEVHELLEKGFGIGRIHSEYGMTELLSQAYSQGKGIFRSPPWMKILIREINDPFAINNEMHYGGVNIIDLANIHSCAFIETGDLGRVFVDGSFEIIGRLDNSDSRGCNLLVN